jgi:hypothetical protein
MSLHGSGYANINILILVFFVVYLQPTLYSVGENHQLNGPKQILR